MSQRILVKGMLFLVLIASIAVPVPARALAGGIWNTGIKVQNLDDGESAIIAVYLYRSDGSLAYTLDKTSSGDPLEAPPGGSVELYMPNYNTVTSGQYSAVVMSSTRIGVVATHTDYAYGLADSYNGMEGEPEVYVPYVYHDHNSWTTEMFVQNTSSSETAHVYATLSNGVVTRLYTMTLAPSGSGSFNTAEPAYADLGWFIGAATITSTEGIPLAVMVNETRVVGDGDVNGNVMVSFRGLASGDAGARVVLPSLYKEFSGVSGTWRSGIKIQNTSGSPVTVTVTLRADPDSPTGAWSGKRSELLIAPGESKELYLRNAGILDGGGSVPDMFKGYGVIEAVGGDVVATVIHTNYEASGGKGIAIGYLGIAQGSNELSIPSLYKYWATGSGGWISGIKIQNVGNAAATITIDFGTDPDSPNATWTGTRSGILLDPQEAVELYLANPILDGGQSIPSPWKGSAWVSCAEENCEIAGTVIHTNYSRNVANMYMAIGK